MTKANSEIGQGIELTTYGSQKSQFKQGERNLTMKKKLPQD